MNFEEAARLMDVHRNFLAIATGVVARHNPERKRLGNQTWLSSVSEIGGPRARAICAYDLSLFDKTIIRFYENSIELHDHGIFSVTTLDRFNTYLPPGWRVFGETIRSIKRNAPGYTVLGFIQTPCGIFPYNLPMHFTSQGEPSMRMASQAREAVNCIAAYVDENIRELLREKSANKIEAGSFVAEIRQWIASDIVSQKLGRALIHNTQHKGLCRYYAAENHIVIYDMLLSEIVDILMLAGAGVFRKQRPAKHLEQLLYFKRHLPVIPIHKLKTVLRKTLTSGIVGTLGFAPVTWNRR